MEVPNIEVVPQDMAGMSIPAYTFVTSEYEGENVHEVYSKLYNWIDANKYRLDQEELEHYEEFHIDYNPIIDVPKLKLHIPIKTNIYSST